MPCEFGAGGAGKPVGRPGCPARVGDPTLSVFLRRRCRDEFRTVANPAKGEHLGDRRAVPPKGPAGYGPRRLSGWGGEAEWPVGADTLTDTRTPRPPDHGAHTSSSGLLYTAR